MNPLDPVQYKIATLLFALPTAEGYALAGGSALIVHGVIDRLTRDVDAFVSAKPGQIPGSVTPLAKQLTEALRTNDWAVDIVREHDTFVRLVATKAEQSVEVDLAVDSPPLFPIDLVDGLPVLAPQDLAARKVLAIIDRAEGRDFTDLNALQERYGREDCVEWAMALDSGVTKAAIVIGFSHLDRLKDAELPTSDPDQLRSHYAEWGRHLSCD